MEVTWEYFKELFSFRKMDVARAEISWPEFNNYGNNSRDFKFKFESTSD